MQTIFEKWQSDQEREQLCSELMEKYDLYADMLFNNYEPLVISNAYKYPRDFLARLEKWINNFGSDEQQWNAFQFVDDIFYLGKNELIELYRVVFEVIVPEWLCQIHNIDLRSTSFSNALEGKKEKSWFCPITDSLRISAFRHINHIEKPDFFPDWRSLSQFGNEAKIKKYIEENEFEQLILMEDFVGSGKQVTDAIKFAQSFVDIPILIVPLVIGRKGDEVLSNLSKASADNVSYRPVIVLDGDNVVKRIAEQNESNICIRARGLVDDYRSVTGDKNGYGFEKDQGYLFVAEANCPNNSVTLIHSQRSWSPLFPRSGRKK